MNTRRIIASTIIPVLLVAVYEVYARCIGCPPPGEVLPPCRLVNTAVFTFPNGTTSTSQSKGNATFQIVDGQEGPGAFNTHRILGFTAQTDLPDLGTISWLGDLSRPTTLSSVVSDDERGNFPGISDIYMHVIAKISGMPGKTFRSRTEVHVRNSRLKTWAPQENEAYQLVDPVEFEDADTGQLAFTLTGLTSIINGG